MASGFKDYQTQVNISGQALRPVLARAYLGRPLEVTSQNVFQPGETKNVMLLEDAGITLGGLIELRGSVSRKIDTFSISIDNRSSKQWSASTLLEFQNFKIGLSYLHLLKYDDVNFVYLIGIMPGLVFDTSFRIAFNEVTGSTVTVKALLDYGLTS